ncbi:MAG: GNAT family N-acetyltransferase [Oscillospiraceae bacterium]|nr:GNAT family N-acetyltransferase [Oscillospiraceae bacterium]
MRYKLTKGLENCPDAVEIRKQVFIEEQGFKNEFNDTDKDAFHVVIFVKNRRTATGRLFWSQGGCMKIGRVAVLSEYRGKSLGSLVIAVLEKKARELCCEKIELSAQTRVAEFYKRLGYAPYGEEYTDEGCPHIAMVKILK